MSDILGSALTRTQLQRVTAIPGVRSATGVLLETERLDRDHPLLVEIGIRPRDLRPFGVSLIAGRRFGANSEHEVLLGTRLVQDLNIHLGDRINVAGGPKTVVGVFSTGNVFGDSAAMFPLVPFQAFGRTGRRKDRVRVGAERARSA